jgi:4-amino-4-deoxy-L-arabinose transferase-like glycosyltransferase
MTYRVIAELLDGVAGLLGAALLLGDVIFRHLSTMVMSHPLMLLQLLLMTWAWLRWRRSGATGFSLLLGVFMGWAAITRPLDAIVFAAPLGAMFLWDLRSFSRRVRWISLGTVIAAALPFCTLQLILDRELTGRWLSTPVTMYHDQYWPQVKIGFGSGGDQSYRPPATIVPEFKDYYDHYIWKSYADFRRTNPLKLALTSRLPLVLDTALPFPLLLIFAPLSVFALADRRRWPLLLALPMFVAAYASFMFFRKQYCVVLFLSVYLAVLMGIDALRRSVSAKWRAAVTSGSVLLVLLLVVMKLPEINRSVSDQMTPTPILHDTNVAIASLTHRPALVFITYHPEDPDSWSQEPVYNTDVVWPDDAEVVRAHDVGAKENAKLVAYYANLSPRRWVYIYDKSTRQLRSLGWASSVVSHPELLQIP